MRSTAERGGSVMFVFPVIPMLIALVVYFVRRSRGA